jgi:plastocyanin
MKFVAVVFSLALVFAGGCSGQGAPSVPAAPLDGTKLVSIGSEGLNSSSPISVGVRLDPQQPLRDPRYGFVLGYFRGTTSHNSQVISVSMGKAIKFTNVDGNDPHTVSFLGNATARTADWPDQFNGSAKKSPAGTAIGTAHFSTGALNPGQTSAVYNTGLPGFYMVGCAFHYDSHKMRTVIIVR